MLVNLYVKNYILIQELSVSLSEHFNVFTGETGAGKSMLVDALNFVSGARSSSSVIGKHGNRALVEASFSLSSASVFYQELDQLGYIEDVQDLIIVTRELTQDGRNICRINGRTVNVSTLRDLMSLTVDIHSQHETQYLLNPKHQLSLLDIYLNDEPLLASVKTHYEAYRETLNEIKALQNMHLSGYELEFAVAQLKELDDFKPSLEDYDSIKDELKQLDNYEKHKAVLNEIEMVLTGSEDVLGKLFSVKDQFRHLASLQEAFEDVYYRLEDISYQVSKINSTTTFDEHTYEQLQSRLYQYNQLIRKYGSLDRLLTKKKELEVMIHNVEHQEQVLEDLNYTLTQRQQALDAISQSLRASRKNSAQQLILQIEDQCRDLMLEHVRFDIAFKECDYTSRGMDEIVFMVSMNKGEPLQDLATTASGGELSRVMLAMKVIFSNLQGITTLVFDEIDTGVSGKVSLKIGEKMKQIARDTQVLTITHYGTVAACAHSHYLIQKSQEEESTITSVVHLNQTARVEELAIMMSGSSDKTAMDAAEKLFEMGQSL